MALGKVKPAEPANEPSEADKLAAEQERGRLLEQQVVAQQAADTARKEAYDQELASRYQQAQQQVAPQRSDAAEVYQAQKDLGITDEDLAEKPAESVRKIAQYQGQLESQRLREGLAPVVGNLVRQSSKLQLRELASDPYYEDVAPYVNQYFDQNPDEMLKEGRIQEVYYELAGRTRSELEKRRVDREAAKAPPDTPAIPPVKAPPLPSINTPPAGGTIAPLEKKKGAQLTEEESYLMNIYNRLGADLDPDEWSGIRKGQLLPKSRRAADWQAKIPEDAHVANYESSEFEPEA